MEPIKHISAVLIATALILGGQVQAQADWSNTGMHPAMGPNFTPNQGQPMRHEVPTVRVEPQHRVEVPRPAANRPPTVRRDVNRQQVVERHDARPGYFRRDVNYYGHVEVPFPYADVDSGFTVPDGFETVVVNGETFYYDNGVFYQEVDNQLTAIPAVLGAVVDSIPQDYEIVMADGVHYLVTSGVYYQRVDQGFEVVQPPASDLE